MELPRRKNIRLKGYDYSSEGAYFITICIESRGNVLGEIRNGERMLNEYGVIVDECIDQIATLHDGIEINHKTVMPNHIHFIMSIVGGAYYAPQDIGKLSMQEKSKMIVPKMVQQFKTATVKRCKEIGLHDNGLHNMQPLRWQRGYYEHIIRDEKEYLQIWHYIDENPARWEEDEYYYGKTDYHQKRRSNCGGA